jgi:protein O-mannosyl-transferase
MAKKPPSARTSGKARKTSVPPDPWGSLQAVQAIDKKVWLLLAAMVVGIVLIYARALGYGFTAWDDPGYVTENPALGPLNAHQVGVEFDRNVMGNFHPITMLSYALDISLAGEKSARMMHLTALLLHAVNALLVFLLIRALLGDALFAVLVALLFAWHPMRVESVAWISDRKDLLMMFFGVLTMLCYVKALRSRSVIWLLAALPLFVLACLSKATAVALVPSLLLIDLLAGRSLKTWRPWLEKVLFAAIALVIGLLTVPAPSSSPRRTSLSTSHNSPFPSALVRSMAMRTLDMECPRDTS